MLSSPRSVPGTLWLGLGILVASLSLVVLFAQHTSLNTRLYLASAELGAFNAGALVSEIALLSLVALWSGCALVLLLRRAARPLARLAAGGIGSGLAYGASVVSKNIFAQVRPCNAMNVMAECPDPGNWSFPSNHTVIAACLAVAIVFAIPKVGYLALPLAVVVGVARVFAGHHYPQDVLGGAALGIGVGLVCILLLGPVVLRLLRGRCDRRAGWNLPEYPTTTPTPRH